MTGKSTVGSNVVVYYEYGVVKHPASVLPYPGSDRRRRRIGGISGRPQGGASGNRRKSDCNKSAMGCSFGRSLPAIDITQYTDTNIFAVKVQLVY